MRTLTRFSLALAGSAALVGSMALPASAAEFGSGENGATVTIEAGYLTLDTSAQALEFIQSDLTASGSTLTGSLSGLSVIDYNNDGSGWTSTATLTDLTDEAGKVIDVSGAGFTTTVTDSLGATVAGGSNTVTATGPGNNTATWNMAVTIALPNDITAGTYKGMLTHSVS